MTRSGKSFILRHKMQIKAYKMRRKINKAISYLNRLILPCASSFWWCFTKIIEICLVKRGIIGITAIYVDFRSSFSGIDSFLGIYHSFLYNVPMQWNSYLFLKLVSKIRWRGIRYSCQCLDTQIFWQVCRNILCDFTYNMQSVFPTIPTSNCDLFNSAISILTAQHA